jgi:PAS domain S-box-containing protein
MNDRDKTKVQLVEESAHLRQRIAELEAVEIEQVQLEKVLRESEAKNQAVLNALSDLMFIHSRDGTYLDYHAADTGDLYVPSEQLLGKKIQDVLPEKVAAGFLDLIEQAGVTDKGQLYEYALPIAGQLRYFEARIVPYGEDKVLSIVREITERKRNEAINASRLHLAQFSTVHSLDELLEETLNETEKLTGSLISFYHFVEDDQASVTLQNWSTRTKSEFCKAEGKGTHYAIAEAGVWVDCVYQRKPVIHNDYASLPHRKGMPEGHAPVIRELVVPVIRGEKIKAILGVGNKPTDYTQEDVETVSLFADLAWEIAERKRAEEALHRAMQEWEEIFQAVGHPTLILSPQHTVLAANRSAAETTGMAAEELAGKYCYEVFHGIAQVAEDCPMAQMLHSGRLETAKIEALNNVFLVSCTPVFNAQGKLEKVIHVATDITEREWAEERLKDSEERLHLTLEAAQIGTWDWDVKNDQWYASPIYYAMLGYEPRQGFMDRSEWLELVHPDDCADVLGKIRDVSTQDFRAYECDARMRHADGTYRWQNVVGFGIGRDPDGKVTRVLGIGMDITDRKRAEESLRESEGRYRTLFEDSSISLWEEDFYQIK